MAEFSLGQRVAVHVGVEYELADGRRTVVSQRRSRKKNTATISAILPAVRREERKSYLVRYDTGAQAIVQASEIEAL